MCLSRTFDFAAITTPAVRAMATVPRPYFAVTGFVGIAIFRAILRTALRHVRARGYNLRYALESVPGVA